MPLIRTSLAVVLLVLGACTPGGKVGTKPGSDASSPADSAANGGGDSASDSNPVDADGDGYISTAQGGSDCDDTSADVHPGAAEVCDGIDNDCDGVVDPPNSVDAPTWYADTDGDGYGDPASGQTSCSPINGFVANDADCGPDDPSVHPGAVEVCNGLDDDCDGTTDPSSSIDARVWYADADADTFGDPGSSVLACSQPTGTVSDNSDCDDSAPAVHPGGIEVCDGVDDDCDGLVDPPASVDASSWFPDVDGDSFGDVHGAAQVACGAPPGTVLDATDCDDGAATTFPGAPETCNGTDDDCDGVIDEDDAVDAPAWYPDADADGFGDATLPSHSCAAPAGFLADSTDCNDADAQIAPDIPEVCDGVDQNCDGVVDNDALDADVWYADADADGFGDPSESKASCTQPAGYIAANADGSNISDCDDTNAVVNPGAALDACGNGDDDCDGTTDEDCYLDECGSITTATSWNYPRIRLTCDISVRAGLVIGFADTVYADPGVSVSVTGSGYLQAPAVLFTSSEDSPAPGDWDGISLANPSKETYNDLDGTTVLYAGGEGSPAVTLSGISTDISGLYVGLSGGTGLELSAYDGTLTDPAVWYGVGAGVVCSTEPCWTDVSGLTVEHNAGFTLDLPFDTFAALDFAAATLEPNDLDVVRVTGDGTLTTDTTWDWESPTLQIAGAIGVGDATAFPELTITDGTTIAFESGGSLTTGDATLQVQGTTAGVLFTSAEASPAPGDWSQVIVGGGSDGSVLDGLTVEYGGSGSYGSLFLSGDNVTLTNSTVRDSRGYDLLTGGDNLSITDSTFSDSTNYGVYVGGADTLGVFTGNTISGNVCGMSVAYDAASTIDATNTFPDNSTGAVCLFTPYWNYGISTTSQTLAGLDGPWVLTANLMLYKSTVPVLTIDDGAQIDLAGYHMYMGYGELSKAEIVINGDPDGQGVHIWDGGLFLYGDGDSNTISGTTLTDVDVAATYADLTVQDSTVDGADIVMENESSLALYRTNMMNATYGADVSGLGATMTAWEDNTVTGCAYGARLPLEFLAALDPATQLCDPGQYITVAGSAAVTSAITLPAYACPLYLTGANIQDGGALTIEPQTVYIAGYSGMNVGKTTAGSLIADGVAFTSLYRAKGAWAYIDIGPAAVDTSMVGATFDYGGEYTGEIYCDNCTADLTDAAVRNSGTYGIYRKGTTNLTLTGVTYSGNTSGDLY